MFHKYTLPVLFLTFSFNIIAQSLELEWVAEYPCFAPSSLEYDQVTTDEEGSVYFFGKAPESFVQPYGSLTILARKYSPAGEFIWEVKHNNQNSDRFRDFAFGNDGDLLIGGFLDAPQFFFGDRSEIAKYDQETGELHWQTFIFDTLSAESSLYDIQLDENGDIYAFGWYNDMGLFENYDSTRAYIAKIDYETGNPLWTKTFDEVSHIYKGKILENSIRVMGGKIGENGPFLIDLDLEGNIIQNVNLLPIISSTFYPYFSFDENQYWTTYGDFIQKWELDLNPFWSFDFRRDLPDVRGQAIGAESDEGGNTYATGFLVDTLSEEVFLQTLKLSNEGELQWASVQELGEGLDYGSGQHLAVSEHHVFACHEVGSGEYPDLMDDYYIVLHDLETGEAVYDTTIHVKGRDIVYDAHYAEGSFYLLGRSYESGSSNPDDYRYQLIKFKADEPVSSIKKINMEHTPQIFPNPASGEINVVQKGKLYFDEFFIIGASGELVFSGNISGRAQHIKLPALPSGIYSLKLKNGETEYSEKLVIVSQ